MSFVAHHEQRSSHAINECHDPVPLGIASTHWNIDALSASNEAQTEWQKSAGIYYTSQEKKGIIEER